MEVTPDKYLEFISFMCKIKDTSNYLLFHFITNHILSITIKINVIVKFLSYGSS